MNSIGLHLRLHTVILAIAFCATVQEGKAETATFSQPDLQAKIVYCKTCHGLSGEGFRGNSIMPRLAGQQIEYFANQMRAFAEGRRKNKFMLDAAKVISPTMMTSLAMHFKDLNPAPVGGAPRELVAAGRQLYEQGIAATDIQPCSSCHGPEAEGHGIAPRLAGQLASYTLKTLTNWSKERGQDAANPDDSAIMEPIAHSLTQAQMSALAAYLSDLGTPSRSPNNEAQGEMESLGMPQSPQHN